MIKLLCHRHVSLSSGRRTHLSGLPRGQLSVHSTTQSAVCLFETELNGYRYKATPSCIPVSSPPPTPISRTQFWSLLTAHAVLCVLMDLHLSRFDSLPTMNFCGHINSPCFLGQNESGVIKEDYGQAATGKKLCSRSKSHCPQPP